jgi:predicted deacylase
MHPDSFQLDQFLRGSRHKLELEFTADGHALSFPVLVTRGIEPGPVLLASAGVHGDEYEGVRAILEVFEELRPEEMRGDFVAVPALNTPAVWNCSRTSPLDGANLARVFPGNRDGSPTEAIAWHFDQRLLSLADLYVDLHSAGVACEMPLLIGYYAPDERARAAALAFGAPVVWAHPTIAPGRTVSAAKDRNIPALYTEARGAGRIDLEDLAVYKRGLRNLLRHLGILPGDLEAGPRALHLSGDGNIDDSVLATRQGFLVPHCRMLDAVQAGDVMGVLLDLMGNPLETYIAPRGGVVALIHASPRVLAGDPVFLITGVHP